MKNLLVASLLVGLCACGSMADISLSTGLSHSLELQSCDGAWEPQPILPFHSPLSGWTARAGANHTVQDLIDVPGEAVDLRGTFAYGPLRWRLINEDVDAFVHDCKGWQPVGQATTGQGGDTSVRITTEAFGAGHFAVGHNVQGDGTMQASELYLLPAGTSFVVFDIDGTVYRNGNAQPFSAELTHLWQSKGYTVLYLTGRPIWLQHSTQQWLQSHGFAKGPLHVAETNMDLLPMDAGVGTYKASFLQSLSDRGYILAYGYGDADTDVRAYARAGVGTIFHVARDVSLPGATPLHDYTGHLAVVEALPDATYIEADP